jgi:aminobenzoyl-glutamate utilization protein B
MNPIPRRVMAIWPLQFAALALLLLRGAAAQQLSDSDRAALLERLDRRADHFAKVAQQIWEFAEVGYQETKSAALLQDELRSAGFVITENIGNIPTAFSAQAGRGSPVIGILGEYDALPGLFQEAVPMKQPARSNKAGHGCGHNLFGTASAAAAIAVKEWLAEQGREGTVRFYGCPAEEGGGGKIYMARAGAFSDCDVVLHWHPGTENRGSLKTNLGNMTGKFRFRGTAAHAAGAPDKGRSALDGVMLFTHAVELLREHVPQTTRIHYVITSGGDAPNVVPAFAEVFLYLRSPEMKTIDDVWPRILKCAQAGALGTETKFELEIVNSAYSILPNDELTKLIERNLRRVGGNSYTPQERAFAEALQQTFLADSTAGLGGEARIAKAEEGISYGSTDVGDVSWVVPTAGFSTATFVPGTPGHSWQSTACAGMSIGHKGMVVAAKTLALTALDLFTSPAEVEAAKRSFADRKAGKEYRSRLPAGQKPPLDYRNKAN